MSDTTPCYIAREPDCGCPVGAVVDMPEHRKSTAKDVAGWMRQGLTIERMTVEEVRKLDFGCSHHPAVELEEPKRRSKTGKQGAMEL